MSCRTIITRILSPIIKMMTVIAGTALVSLLVVSGGDIIGRTLFESPIEGSSNIISALLFPACVFFSLPYLASISGHIRVDFADKWLAPVAKPVAILFAVLTALFLGAIAWQAGARAYEAFILNQRSIGAFGIPAALSYGVVALGAGVAALAHLAWMFNKPSYTEY